MIAEQQRHLEPEKKMVIECDGHDFHERTKEQARRDRKSSSIDWLLGLSI